MLLKRQQQIKPLRNGYGWTLMIKHILDFDGTNDDFTFRIVILPITTDFTIFEVSKIDKVSDNIFGWYKTSDGAAISMGTDANGLYYR